MKRKIKEIEKVKVDSKIQYKFVVEATPSLLDKILGYGKRKEFYTGYGSVWYRNYFGDLEAVSDTEWEANGYVERCSSYVEPWLTDQFAKLGLSLNKEK